MSKTWAPVPRLQPDAPLNQPNPVQNQWYTILDTTPNCRLILVEFSVQVAGEQMEIRITTDDVTLLMDQAINAGSFYYLRVKQNTENGLEAFTGITGVPRPYLVESQNVKVEIRKTSNNGNGQITGLAKYARW